MPRRFLMAVNAVVASETAGSVPQSLVSYAFTVKFGKLAEMTFVQPSARSLAFKDVRSPSIIAIVPGPVACLAMYSHDLVPYAVLSARTIMYTLPWLGATSTVTTGMCLVLA